MRAAEAAARREQEKTKQQQPAALPEQHQQQAGPPGAGAASRGAAAMAGTAAAAGRVDMTAASLLRVSDSARAAEEQAWEVLSRARVSQRPLLWAGRTPQSVCLRQ